MPWRPVPELSPELYHLYRTACPARHYKNPRHERRVKSAWAVAADCDLLLFLVDAHRQVRLSRDGGWGYG